MALRESFIFNLSKSIICTSSFEAAETFALSMVVVGIVILMGTTTSGIAVGIIVVGQRAAEANGADFVPCGRPAPFEVEACAAVGILERTAAATKI